jgi:hypothetical protein
VGHSVGLVLNATREWFIRFCATPNNLGVPVSSWGTLEYNRVGLTLYSLSIGPQMPMITPIFDILQGPILYICVQFIRGSLIERRRVESIHESNWGENMIRNIYFLHLNTVLFYLLIADRNAILRLHFLQNLSLYHTFFFLKFSLSNSPSFYPLILSQLFSSTFSLTQLVWTDSYTLYALFAGQGVCCKEWQGVGPFYLLINKCMSIYCASHLYGISFTLSNCLSVILLSFLKLYFLKISSHLRSSRGP